MGVPSFNFSLFAKRLPTMLMKRTALTVALGSVAALVGPLLPGATHAQQAPHSSAVDSGRVLQEQRQPVAAPKERAALTLPSELTSRPPAGGKLVEIKGFVVNGNSVIPEGDLRLAVLDQFGKSLDLSQLYDVAERLTKFYRERGYPFARVLIPPQTIEDGMVRIEVVEGRYGRVRVVGDLTLTEEAQRYLSGLVPGEVIVGKTLERATLLLADQPGVKARPIIRPGERPGTGDLEVLLEREGSRVFSVGADNHGSRYTGRSRLRLAGVLNSAGTLGDQITITAARSNKDLTLGSFGVSMPLGRDGWKGAFLAGYSSYILDPSLGQREGTALSRGISLAYPMLRSNASNLTFNLGYTHKRLKDQDSGVGWKKTTHSAPVSFDFDFRDQTLGSSAVTYGNFTAVVGDLDRDQIARDLEPAIPEGGFDKVSLELVRKQLLPGDLQASFRYLRQSTGRNLDSSEDFLLGGPSGVRSYPTGEAAGDTGWLGQLELSKRLSAFFTPYVFYDEGRSRAAVSQNVRQRRSGYGLGLKYADKGFSSDVLVGWQQTGRAQSDPLANHYMVWATASYQF